MSAQVKILEKSLAEKSDASLFGFYVNLREDILAILREVQDAEPSGGRDYSKPNSSIRHNLEKIFERYSELASRYGFYRIEAHSYCDNVNSTHAGSAGSLYVGKINGRRIFIKEDRYAYYDDCLDAVYRLGGDFGYEPQSCKCPCSENAEPTKHNIVEGVLFDIKSDQPVCRSILSILESVYSSVLSADNRRPRSAIREDLLRAILKINDQLLPLPMEELIKIEKKKHSLG